MILPIHLYGDPVLSKKSDDIPLPFKLKASDFVDEILKALVSDMFETMYNAKGAGLALPQTGINKRLIVVEQKISDFETFKGVFFNPHIIEYKGQLMKMEEGCLSVPGVYANIVRQDEITIEYYDEDYIYHKETFRGIKSRILQHEIDHLEGILFVNKLTPTDRLTKYMKLENIKNRKHQYSYPTK